MDDGMTRSCCDRTEGEKKGGFAIWSTEYEEADLVRVSGESFCRKECFTYNSSWVGLRGL